MYEPSLSRAHVPFAVLQLYFCALRQRFVPGAQVHWPWYPPVMPFGQSKCATAWISPAVTFMGCEHAWLPDSWQHSLPVHGGVSGTHFGEQVGTGVGGAGASSDSMPSDAVPPAAVEIALADTGSISPKIISQLRI